MATTAIDRLTTFEGCRIVTAGTVDEFLADTSRAILFFAGDPRQRPESTDVAVVLRELLGMFPGQFKIGIVDPAAETALKGRFGAVVVPTLVFVRDGQPDGTIPRIQDWSVYVSRTRAFLAE
jgi:hydrogenase-1 operon protein HyaE